MALGAMHVAQAVPFVQPAYRRADNELKNDEKAEPETTENAGSRTVAAVGARQARARRDIKTEEARGALRDSRLAQGARLAAVVAAGRAAL
jgi:hypothetical protein